jgi:drug/metabolite transporter (DMT)-like permease
MRDHLPSSHRIRWLLLMAVPPLLWAGNALLARATIGDIPPIALSFWRWVVALAITLPFTAREIFAHRADLLRAWRRLAVLGLLGIGAYNTLLYLALQTTTAINATLVGASMPLMILVLARVWLAEPIRPPQVAGILVSLLGVLTVISHGDLSRLLGLEVSPGDGLMLVATLGWAIYSVLLKRPLPPVSTLALLTVLIAIGIIFILPVYLWELSSGARMAAGWVPPAAILYTGTLASLVAYTLWNRGVREIGAATAGQYSYLIPLFTALLGVGLLREPFHWHHAIGGGLIFLGFVLANRRPGGQT